MATSPLELSSDTTAVFPSRAMRRLSQTLFAFLQTASLPNGTDRLTSRKARISELPGQDIALALSLRSVCFALPADLKLIPDRLTRTPTLKAAGFADSWSKSVGVDIANWSRPCAPDLDEIGWRRVFTWIVGTDDHLTNVSILEPPSRCGDRLIGSYGYDAGGIPGYGVLQITEAGDGSWQICDCWGDAVEADRVDELACFAPLS